MSVRVIFGGTFNPLHIGHYRMLEALCKEDWIDKVLLMPDNVPPHKVCDFLASDEDRIEMCRLACEDFNKAELCLIEFEREGKSYTVDTVMLLKERYPDDRLFIACGGDMVATLNTWYKAETLFELTSFVAFRRGGIADFDKNVELQRGRGAKIRVIDADIPEISSSELRLNMSREMLPEKIADYILKNGVYNANYT